MSRHLDNIIKNHEGVASLQVVFVDIEKYSKRRTKTQNEVIGKFTAFLKEALTEVSKKFIVYIENNNINLKEDTIILPTGDGAAIVFSFDGLEEIHLEYAKALLKLIYEFNKQSNCKKFFEDGYCHDHSNLNLRIGVSKGDGLIYRDVNDRYNAAGDVINMAARVMYLADRNQIVFTEQAHEKIIDLVETLSLDDHFIRYPQVKLKHDVVMNVYQYVEDQEYLNPARLKIGKLLDQYGEERELLERYSEIEKAGFRKIYPDRQEFFNELFQVILKEIKEELKIMGICVSLFRESDKPVRKIAWNSTRTAESLIELIERGCNVKVLFLKRYLNADECKYYGIGQKGDFYFMRERDEDFDYDFRRGRRLKIISNHSIGKLINILLELARRSQNDDVDKRRDVLRRLQIREYISLPSVSLYIADEDIYVTPYLCKRHCSTVPAFKISGRETDLYTAYNGNFEAIWKSEQTTSVINEMFLQYLINEPKRILELFEHKYKEISDYEAEKVRRNPFYNEDPERYRLEEKTITEVINSINSL